MQERRKNDPNLIKKAIGGDLQEGESQVRTQIFLSRKSLKIRKDAQKYNKASQ